MGICGRSAREFIINGFDEMIQIRTNCRASRHCAGRIEADSAKLDQVYGVEAAGPKRYLPA